MRSAPFASSSKPQRSGCTGPPLDGEEQQPGPIANGLHGSSGGFDPAQYFKYENGQMFNGLSVVGFNLCDIGPGDGGFACVPGTVSSSAQFAAAPSSCY